jgi:hypothetical protein
VVELGTPALDPVPAELSNATLYVGELELNVGVDGVPGGVPATPFVDSAE